MTQSTLFDEPDTWVHRSMGLKICTVAVLVLLLLIPRAMVSGLITERQRRQGEAVEEISQKWGRSQTVGGPVITVPYRTYCQTDTGRMETGISYAHFLTDELTVRGTVRPEIRHRGIYEAVLYTAQLEICGCFAADRLGKSSVSPADTLWEDAVLSLSISDMRGICDSVVLEWGGRKMTLVPGPKNRAGLGPSLHARLAGDLRDGGTRSFRVLVELDGSAQLQFLPLGRITNVELSSAWRDPSFCGAFLPDSHEIGHDGFSAHWKVLDLNRSYPQRWQDTAYQTRASAFGVELMFPVDGYHKTSRTTKYAILFIALTFLSLFMTEILTRRRVHPVQYLLVGFALCVFYSLLLALMEHVGFGRAYLVSAAATVLLIGGYTRAVLGGWAMAALIGGIVTAIYAYLYVVLQLEDYALLMGSGGLFVTLSLVMYLTRRIDWYAVGHEKNARHDNG